MNPYMKTTESGSVLKKEILINNNKFRYKTTHPVHTQWTITDLLPEIKKKGQGLKFDLLQDAQIFKPNQELSYEGKVSVDIKDNKKVVLDNFLHIGYGVLPTNYLVDKQGRVQMTMAGFMCLALQKTE